MDKNLLIEIGINKLEFNLYNVVVRNFKEQLNIELKSANTIYSNLKINFSKNRIVIYLNIDSITNVANIKMILNKTVENTIIPIKNLALSNVLNDYIVWIQGIFKSEYFYFENIKLTEDIKQRFLFTKIEDINSYKPALEEIDIIFENDSRRKFLINVSNKLAKENGVKLYKSSYVIENYINEYNLPYPIIRSIDNKYFKYPSKLLVAIMLDVCNVVPVVNEKKLLMPYFIFCVERKNKENIEVINKKYSEKIELIEHTLQQFERAMNYDLDYYLDKMKNTVLKNNIGTLYDETARLKEFTKIIGNYLKVGEDTLKNLETEANICKLDLVSEIVKNTPELSGIVGYLYAEESGYNEIVSSAIYMYHRPRFYYDELPESTSSKILSIADKLDSITNTFIYNITNGIDNTYQTTGLRRKASGIINIIINNKWKLNIETLVNDLIYIYIKNNKLIVDYDILKEEIINFIISRYREELINQGFEYEIIDTVIQKNPYNISDSYEILGKREVNEK